MLQEQSEEFDYSIANTFALFDAHQADNASSDLNIEIILSKILSISTFGIRGLVAAGLLYLSD